MKCHSGGDWHPGWGVDPSSACTIHGAIVYVLIDVPRKFTMYVGNYANPMDSMREAFSLILPAHLKENQYKNLFSRKMWSDFSHI